MKKIRHTFFSVKNNIESSGYILLSNSYKDNRTKLKIQCDKGHLYLAAYRNFQNGSRCPKCYGNQKLNNESISNRIMKGYKLLSQYKNCRTKLKIQCDKGHIYKSKSISNNYRCPICSKNNRLTYVE